MTLLLHQATLPAAVESLLTGHEMRVARLRTKPDAPDLFQRFQEIRPDVVFLAGLPAYVSAMLDELRPLCSAPLIVLVIHRAGAAPVPESEWLATCGDADDILYVDHAEHTNFRLNAIARTALRSARERQSTRAILPQPADPVTANADLFAAFLDRLRDSIMMHTNHELRTPSMQLKSAIEGLRRSWTLTGTHADMWVDYAIKASDKLIDQVLDICDLAGLAEINISPFPADEPVTVARGTFIIAGREAEWERVRVVYLPSPPPPIYSDRNALGRVLRELLDNALKFDQSEAVIELLVESTFEGVRYSVADQGIGIPESEIQHIFEPFYRPDVSNTTRYSGIGNGLAFVKAILDMLNIAIEVHSALGKGSTFSFIVPTDPDGVRVPALAIENS